MNDNGEWAKDAAAKGEYVLHRNALVLGKVAHAYAVGDYIDPNGVALECPIVVLEDGNKFIANRDAFTILTEKEAEFALVMQGALSRVAAELAPMMRAMQVDPRAGVEIFRAVLQRQANALGGKGKRS